ncbi:hypothetical protein J3F83DRAFT_403442 [Trichoderma novae-zelandiae]
MRLGTAATERHSSSDGPLMPIQLPPHFVFFFFFLFFPFPDHFVTSFLSLSLPLLALNPSAVLFVLVVIPPLSRLSAAKPRFPARGRLVAYIPVHPRQIERKAAILQFPSSDRPGPSAFCTAPPLSLAISVSAREHET